MREVVLGADLGTSGLKLVALDLAGDVVAEAEADLPVDRPRPGWAQADVAGWRVALDALLERVAPDLAGTAVRGLGLSGQMHGLVLLDAAGAPLGPALLWQDTRAEAEVARWRALPAADRAALANPPVPGWTGPLLAWTAVHEPGRLAGAAAAVLPKDALRAALLPAAGAATDRSDASATLLWDLPGERWSPAATAAAGVPAALLPPVRPADAVAGELPLAGADVPVVVGGADTALALLAAGEGGAQLNLGTGAQLLAPGWTPAAVPEPAAQHHAGVLDGWYAQVGLRTGASAWSWAREALGLDWPGFWAAAAGAAPGAGGVRFTPFLTGEPALGDRPAGWTGVTTATGRAELARAAVEGVAFAVAAAADLLALPEGPLTLTGGGGRSELVAQLLADALGRPVRRVAVRSASATGAAALAARGAGLDLAVRRDAASPVDPGPDAAVLADAAAAWRAGLRVERDRGGHR